MQLVLDVPEGDTLLAWAAAPHKRLAAQVIFRDANGGSAIETLALQAAYCVRYHEQFVSGDAAGGSYQCYVTLSDPDGWTLSAGGPAAAFVAPAARDHGVPATLMEQESDGVPTGRGEFGLTTPRDVETTLPAVLVAIIERTFLIGEDDTDLFKAMTQEALHKIYTTPTGKALLESLDASGKTVHIDYNMVRNDISGYSDKGARFYQPDGTPGAGTSSRIGYNPALHNISKAPWGSRPPAIALAHELVHAEQAAYGRMRPGRATNGNYIPKADEISQADVRELEAVGVPPHDTYPFSENKIRQEWSPPQPLREHY